jgi:hypothetical protein
MIGSAPLIRKIDCQPKCARIAAFRNPPTVPPNGNAAQIRLATIARRRCGGYSEASAMKHGVAPPRPTPATKRTAKISAYDPQ